MKKKFRENYHLQRIKNLKPDKIITLNKYFKISTSDFKVLSEKIYVANQMSLIHVNLMLMLTLPLIDVKNKTIWCNQFLELGLEINIFVILGLL